jgi:hypothetical protein
MNRSGSQSRTAEDLPTVDKSQRQTSYLRACPLGLARATPVNVELAEIPQHSKALGRDRRIRVASAEFI